MCLPPAGQAARQTGTVTGPPQLRAVRAVAPGTLTSQSGGSVVVVLGLYHVVAAGIGDVGTLVPRADAGREVQDRAVEANTCSSPTIGAGNDVGVRRGTSDDQR